MNKINFKGINAETVTGVFILLIALINAVLRMFGVDTIPIENEEISNIISTVFLIVSALWNAYKNRNIPTAAQTAQKVTDAIKSGVILAEDVDEIIEEGKK